MSNCEHPCTICGIAGFCTAYSGKSGERMKRDGICFTCAHWELTAEEGRSTVIDHYVYSVGTRKTPGPYNGMAGRWFDIEYFDGRQVRTCDLWTGGEIPERWRERIPNTARFGNGAERCVAGGITCWNPSSATHSTATDGAIP